MYFMFRGQPFCGSVSEQLLYALDSLQHRQSQKSGPAGLFSVSGESPVRPDSKIQVSGAPLVKSITRLLARQA